MSAASLGSRPAGLARRLASALYESLLLAALAVAIGFALLPWTGNAGPLADAALPLPSSAARAGLFACVFAGCGAYCVGLWSSNRRTLPMRTWQLTLVTASGFAVGPARAAARYLFWWIGPAAAIAAYVALRPAGHARWAGVLLALNYAWALFDPDHSFLHDRLAGTRLVRTDAPRATTAAPEPG